MINIFKKKERKPRIAFREQRDGKRRYFIESYGCFGMDCFYSQNSKEVETLDEAQQLLRDITDKEIVNIGTI